MIELGTHQQSIHGQVRMSCLNRQDELLNLGYDKLVLAHFGEFSIDFISDISERIEQYMISAGDNKAVIKRMFTILIEGMKNIRRHGLRDERGRQLGYLLISQSKNDYLLEVANLIGEENAQSLIGYIDHINGYSTDELREKYNDALDREFLQAENGGGGLGMIVTRLKTMNQLNVRFEKLNERLMLCSFSVKLNRQ